MTNFVLLDDICEIKSGGTPSRNNKEYWENGTIPWIKIGDFNGKYINDCDERITEEGLNNSSAKIFKKGTILYTIFATIGETAILNIDATTNQAIAGIRIMDEEKFDVDFIYYFLKSQKENSVHNSRGVAQNNINLSILKKYKVPNISIESQRQIAHKMELIDNMLENRKQQKADLEKFEESLFYNTFGNPETNEKGYETDVGKNLFEFTSGKFLIPEERKETGYPVFGGNGITWYADNYLIDFKTIVIGRVGAYCGNVRTTPEKSWITDNAIFIKKYKTNKFNIDFLYYLMKTFNISRFASFSGQPKITQKPLNELKYIIPPIKEQENFVIKIDKIKKQKEKIEKDIEDLTKMLEATMNEYFN